MWDRRQTLPVVMDLLSLGIAVYNVDYRRIGEEGGGWPGTFADVAAAVDAMASIDPAVDAEQIVLVGHSAGGHLATWAGLRGALPEGAIGANPVARPVGAVSLSGVLDLAAADGEKFGTGLADSRTFADSITAQGGEVEYLEYAGARHFDTVDPTNPEIWPAVRGWIAARLGITLPRAPRRSPPPL